MKQFSCHIIMLILLVVGIGFHQEAVYAVSAEVEVNGQIGGNKTNAQPQSPKEIESEPNQKLAQPKQTHIGLRKFPSTGSIIEVITPIGLLLLLIYLLLNRWEAHRKTTHK